MPRIPYRTSKTAAQASGGGWRERGLCSTLIRMTEPLPEVPRGRETRLLLATIAVSIAVLVILARFRFPEETARQTPEAAVQAPLERLAARATYDELATTMADLERRLTPKLEVVRVEPERPGGAFAIAPRVTPGRAVVLLGPKETLADGPDFSRPIVSRDGNHDVAVLEVPEVADGAVTMPSGTPRPGPRYVAVVEATSQGPVIRPVYVGRTDILQDPRTAAPLLSVAALQQVLPRGAAVFSLTGTFIGLARDGGSSASLIPADALRLAAEAAQPDAETRGDLGVEVQLLTAPLARASGAERGVVVSHVAPGGPSENALESGDVITAVDGTPVTTVGGFMRVARSRVPGSTVSIQIVRQHKPAEVKVAVRDAGTIPPRSFGSDPGLVMRTIASVGIEVVAVRQGGAAARAGIEAGDIIIRLDGRDAPDTNALQRAFRELAGGAALVLTVQRGTDYRVVALEKR